MPSIDPHNPFLNDPSTAQPPSTPKPKRPTLASQLESMRESSMETSALAWAIAEFTTTLGTSEIQEKYQSLAVQCERSAERTFDQVESLLAQLDSETK